MRKRMILLKRPRLKNTFLHGMKFVSEANCTNPTATFMAKTFGQLDSIRLVIRIVQNGLAPLLCSSCFYPPQKIAVFYIVAFQQLPA